MTRRPDFKRNQRLNRLLKEELSALLGREVRDPRVMDIVLTDVECTEDLKHAKIFYSTHHRDEETRERIQQGLNNTAAFLRGRLGANLRIRRAPELAFILDPALDYGERIESTLRKIKEETNDDGA